MSRLLRCATIFLLLPIASGDNHQKPFTGAFAGGGLYIRNKTLNWLSTWSQCKKLPYKLLQHSANGNQQSVVFQITTTPLPKSCRYQVLHLTHPASSPNLDINWNVTGYQTPRRLHRRPTNQLPIEKSQHIFLLTRACRLTRRKATISVLPHLT